MGKKLQYLLAFVMLAGFFAFYGLQQRSGKRVASDEPVINHEAEITKKVALTFDDGPHPYYTEQLLKGLRKRGVKATFFVIGNNVEAYPQIIEEMQKDGHLIGNHTYSHMQLTEQNYEKFGSELLRTNALLKEITGEEALYVRPPFGSWDKRLEKELNMFPVLWTVDPRDWCESSSERIVRKVCGKIRENDIILLHDQYKTSVTAALEIVDELTARGYEFVTVEEILFD